MIIFRGTLVPIKVKKLCTHLTRVKFKKKNLKGGLMPGVKCLLRIK